MINNQLMYGFLTTWHRWWFLKSDGNTLSISQSFQFDDQNPTICQMLGRFLLATRTNFKIQIPGSPEIKEHNRKGGIISG
jgi:hypothetical protein